jgi:transposase InsO family protein
MDNGPEFIALALRGLCHRCGINAAYIDPGKPWQNGYSESFHSRLRDEYLDGEVLWGVRDARIGLSIDRSYFNKERLHSSHGYQKPSEFAASHYHSQWEQSEDATPPRVASVVRTKEESNYKSVDGCEA